MRKKIPENFTDQEWKEYLDKLMNLKPLNDKEWKEFSNNLKFCCDNPNYKFYPKRTPYGERTLKYPISSDLTHPENSPLVSTICCTFIVFFIVFIINILFFK